jgi:hypothetical protein
MVPRHQKFRPFPEEKQTFTGVGPITHGVSQEGNLPRPLPAQVRKHGLQGFQVSVDVGEDGPLHSRRSPLEYWNNETVEGWAPL